MEKSPYRKLQKEEIDAFEKLYKVQLPTDYRNFLLTHNGLFVEKQDFAYSAQNNSTAYDFLSSFFTLWKHDDPLQNGELSVEQNFQIQKEIEEQSEISTPTVSTRFLAIGVGVDDDFILYLGLDNDNLGKIYIWFHEYVIYEEVLIEVSESLPAFLENLRTHQVPVRDWLYWAIINNDLGKIRMCLPENFNFKQDLFYDPFDNNKFINVLEETAYNGTLPILQFFLEERATQVTQKEIDRMLVYAKRNTKDKSIKKYLKRISIKSL